MTLDLDRLEADILVQIANTGVVVIPDDVALGLIAAVRERDAARGAYDLAYEQNVRLIAERDAAVEKGQR